MIETTQKTIDDVSFYLTQLGFREGKKALVRLTKIVGPGLSRVAMSAKDGDMKHIAVAIFELTESLTEQDLDYFCEVFGAHTEIEDGHKRVRLNADIQNVIFAGRYDLMFKWLGACFEVNFGPLLRTMKSVVKNQ